MSKSNLDSLLSIIIVQIYISLVLLWIAGFVIAKGVISTSFCIIPFYSWYLVIEKGLQLLGWT